MDLVKDFIIPNYNEKFYIIGTYDDITVDHEVAHGFYYLNNEYKKEMDDLISSYKHRRKIQNCLREMGYCEDVINDEIQAYLSTSTKKQLIKCIGCKEDIVVPKTFKKVFKKYSEK